MTTLVDSAVNLAISHVATAPVTPTAGTSLTVNTGDGALFAPVVPCNATLWPGNAGPLPSNAEIVRVTAVVGDVLTITRATELLAGQSVPTAVAIGVGYQIQIGPTKAYHDNMVAGTVSLNADNPATVGGTATSITTTNNPTYFDVRRTTGTSGFNGVTSGVPTGGFRTWAWDGAQYNIGAQIIATTTETQSTLAGQAGHQIGMYATASGTQTLVEAVRVAAGSQGGTTSSPVGRMSVGSNNGGPNIDGHSILTVGYTASLPGYTTTRGTAILARTDLSLAAAFPGGNSGTGNPLTIGSLMYVPEGTVPNVWQSDIVYVADTGVNSDATCRVQFAGYMYARTTANPGTSGLSHQPTAGSSNTDWTILNGGSLISTANEAHYATVFQDDPNMYGGPIVAAFYGLQRGPTRGGGGGQPTWNAAVPYSQYQTVLFGGRVWVSLASSNTGNTPADGSTWWNSISAFSSAGASNATWGADIKARNRNQHTRRNQGNGTVGANVFNQLQLTQSTGAWGYYNQALNTGGAYPYTRAQTNCTISTSANTVTAPSAFFYPSDVGVAISGFGIPTGCYVGTYVSSTVVTLSSVGPTDPSFPNSQNGTSNTTTTTVTVSELIDTTTQNFSWKDIGAYVSVVDSNGVELIPPGCYIGQLFGTSNGVANTAILKDINGNPVTPWQSNLNTTPITGATITVYRLNSFGIGAGIETGGDDWQYSWHTVSGAAHHIVNQGWNTINWGLMIGGSSPGAFNTGIYIALDAPQGVGGVSNWNANISYKVGAYTNHAGSNWVSTGNDNLNHTPGTAYNGHTWWNKITWGTGAVNWLVWAGTGQPGVGTETWSIDANGNMTLAGTITANGTITGTSTNPTVTTLTVDGLTGAATNTRYAGGVFALGPPGSGTFLAGDLVVGTTGNLYVCSTGGSPGTWATAVMSRDFTAKGMLMAGHANNSYGAVSVGSDQTVLQADSTATNGVSWVSAMLLNGNPSVDNTTHTIFVTDPTLGFAYENIQANPILFSFLRTDGNVFAPAALATHEVIGQFNYGGTSVVTGSTITTVNDSAAYMRVVTTQAWTSTANGTRMEFAITANGAATTTPVGLFDQDGSFSVGSSTTGTSNHFVVDNAGNINANTITATLVGAAWQDPFNLFGLQGGTTVTLNFTNTTNIAAGVTLATMQGQGQDSGGTNRNSCKIVYVNDSNAVWDATHWPSRIDLFTTNNGTTSTRIAAFDSAGSFYMAPTITANTVASAHFKIDSGGNMTFGNDGSAAQTIFMGTTNGLKIGDSTSVKIGFFGVTPVSARTGWGTPSGTLSRSALADPTYTATGGTGITAGAFDSAAHRDAIITGLFNVTKSLAALETDLLALGVIHA